MKKIILLCWFLCFSFIVNSMEIPHIIPAVQKMECQEGYLVLGNKISFSLTSSNLNGESLLLQQYLKMDFGIIAEEKKENGIIRLALFPGLALKSGEYILEVKDTLINIFSSSNEGVFYGIQTLRQLLKIHNNKIVVPRLKIHDYPMYSWRAFMLDEARSFKGKKVVFDLLDEMARLKMNIFHWHLTDDQGWRIEIKKYPNLIKIASKRDSTQIGGYKGVTFDGKRHEGYYTYGDIKEIVAYAAQRHILVVPEIEMPGHESAAIAAYPWLGVTGKQIKVPCHFGVQYEVLNVASPRVLAFIEDVLGEVLQLFPSSVIHIGGDEVKYDYWKKSSLIQTYMNNNNIKTFADLQISFTNKISHLLCAKGRRMMGWNDIMGDRIHEYNLDSSVNQSLAKGTIIQFWKGSLDLIKKAAEQGYDIVNSYHYMTYLDYDDTKLSLEKAYSFSPIPNGLPKKFVHHVIGLGCQMWGEEIMSNTRMYKMIFPRIAAYAEVGWTLPANKDYTKFLEALKVLEFKWNRLN